ncbi:amino acid permease [Massilia sp. YIM B02769]|uniref:APC family permease n=1 Tax=Massilia sp. YIM B02769 TaxID=3050129 RepID=UPI0025B6C25F|nr:amino acid permease [Massilia sp. YIM B02769]MDN4058558.1 amino acid permease [Massilia sp. YIM B02769]
MDPVEAARIATGIEPPRPRPSIGLRAAVALIVGAVIGAGIFKAPAIVASFSPSVEAMFGLWLLGGLVSLVGALCYAELATSYPNAGGDYHFLQRAYGRSVAFLFGWARFSVITTGSIALLGFVFGDYLQQVLPFPLGPPGAGPPLYAAAIIVVLTLVNMRGIRAGANTQSWLTLLEVGGLLLIVGAAAFLAEPASGPAASAATAAVAAADTPPANTAPASWGMAMVFVLLTYGGWNEAAYISAEVRDGRRNMVKALVLSVLLITSLYLLVTWACWHTLGLEGMAASDALAADVMRRALGQPGEVLIALLVAVSALTSINATMIVGARTGYAMGCDWPRLRRLGRWDGERGTPAVAMLVQGAAALLLVGLGAAFGSGFKAMVEFTAPVFWLFFLLAGLSLFVLRRREPERPRPFKVPLFPLLPLLFCASCAWMLWSSLSYVFSQTLGGLNAAWIGVAVLALGVLLLPLLRHPPASTGATHPP